MRLLLISILSAVLVSGCKKEAAIAPETCDSAYASGNYGAAFSLCEALASAGSADDQFLVARMHFRGLGTPKDLGESIVWLEKASAGGSSVAQERLGVFYENGVGVSQDFSRAASLYQQAIDQDNFRLEAINNLGVMYEEGRGVPKNLQRAADLYAAGAAQGFAKSQFNLGRFYALDKGVERNLVKASRLYREAADKGLPSAQFALAVNYETGSGVPMNQKTATDWYEEAARNGYTEAGTLLGWRYRKGDRAPVDTTKSFGYFSLASALGDERAAYGLSLLKSSLTEDQVLAGEAFSEKLWASYQRSLTEP